MRILHLSDLHVGNPQPGYEIESVSRKVLADLEAQFVAAPVDLILFSGDLAFGNAPGLMDFDGQLDAGFAFLQKILDVARVHRPDAQLAAVPGNHDLDRERHKQMMKAWLRDLSSDDAVLWKAIVEDDDAWLSAKERLSKWSTRAFRFHQGQGIDVETRFSTPRVDLPGPPRVAIVGLNSAWSAQSDEDQNRLRMSRGQIEDAITWSEGADLKIAFMHHPTNWMIDEEQAFARERLDTHFDLVLHGHSHRAWISGGPPAARLVEGGALYESERHANAYWILDVDVAQGRMAAQSRKYETRGSGGWIPNSIPGLTDDAGKVRLDLRLASPLAPTSEQAGRAEGADSVPVSVPEICSTLQNDAAYAYWTLTSARPESFAIYWPVRQRRTLLIHAVQALVAGYLSRAGARVVLAVDDLGDAESTVALLRADLSRWMRVADPDGSLETICFSDVVAAPTGDQSPVEQPWDVQSRLFQSRGLRMAEFLEATKILKPDADTAEWPEALQAEAKSKRILGTIINYAHLGAACSSDPTQAVLTLGGWDEKPLWKTWRDHLHQRTGHLFTPEISGFAMDRDGDALRWNDPLELSAKLRRKLGDGNHGLVSWTVGQGLLLPSLLDGSRETLLARFNLDGNLSYELACQSLVELMANDPAALDAVAAAISDWYLPA